MKIPLFCGQPLGGIMRQRSRLVLLPTVLVLAVLLFGSAANADHGGTPNIEVTPNSELSGSGAVTVTVTGTGFPGQAGIIVQQCLGKGDGSWSCGTLDSPVSVNGGFQTDVQVQYDYAPADPNNDTCDWSDTESCYIKAVEGDPFSGPQDTAEIVFAGHDSRTPPTQTLTVSKAGTGDGTVASSPAGISCGSTCSASFDSGTVVTLSADAAGTSTFAGWSGEGCSGAGTCQVTMDAARSVTATFTLNSYVLSVAKSGTGGGTVTSSPPGISCGETCTASFDGGTVVTLSAVPDSASTFTGWSGEGCSGTGTCQVTMSAAHSVTATFAVTTYTLTVVPSGTGSGLVLSSPAGIGCGETCSASFERGTVVTLSAIADEGSTFIGWSGDCTGTDPCVVTMTEARSVGAQFDGAPVPEPGPPTARAKCSGSTKGLSGASVAYWKEGTKTYSLTARMSLNLTGVGCPAGVISGYTQSKASVTVKWNQLRFRFRLYTKNTGFSSLRPVLNYETCRSGWCIDLVRKGVWAEGVWYDFIGGRGLANVANVGFTPGSNGLPDLTWGGSEKAVTKIHVVTQGEVAACSSCTRAAVARIAKTTS
jgi:hypothetical protein